MLLRPASHHSCVCTFVALMSSHPPAVSHSNYGFKADWGSLCASKGVSTKIADVWFLKLSSLYSEPTRYYHTLNHIEEMFNWIRKYESQLEDVHAVQFATWFHEYDVSKTHRISPPHSVIPSPSD